MQANPTLDQAIHRAQEHLLSLQQTDGGWKSMQYNNYAGPMATAIVIIVERYLGVLRDEEAAQGVKFLRGLQRPDGSFGLHRRAGVGSLRATSVVYAGLRAAGVPEADPALSRARSYIEASGGFGRVPLLLKVWLCMADVIDPDELPSLPLAHKLVPGVEGLLSGFPGPFFALLSNILPPLIDELKRRKHPSRRRLDLFRRLEVERVIQYLSEHQNQDGDWFGVLLFTALAVSCLHSLGVSTDDPLLQKALRYIERAKVHTPDGMYVVVFRSEIWDTAWSLHVLVESGVPPEDPRIARATRYLLEQQNRRPLFADLVHAKRGAPNVGGWSFSEGNQMHPDCDDTAITLLAVISGAGQLPGPAARSAMDKGLAWVLGMQNRGGGWSSWSRSLITEQPRFRGRDLGDFGDMVDEPNQEITGRVLFCLGRLGFTKSDPVVQKGIVWLQSQRNEEGVWWGRWLVNYLAATSSILWGLRSVDEDMSAPYVRRAVAWMESKQMSDGSWGEGVESYDAPRMAGVGESSPVLTGLVTSALVDAGRGGAGSVRCGVEYLLRTQDSAGSWDDDQVYGVIAPAGKVFYYFDYLRKYFPLYALVKYRAQRPA